MTDNCDWRAGGSAGTVAKALLRVCRSGRRRNDLRLVGSTRWWWSKSVAVVVGEIS